MALNKKINIAKFDKVSCKACLFIAPVLILLQIYALKIFIYHFESLELKSNIFADLIGILFCYVYNNIYLRKAKFINTAFNILGINFVLSGIQHFFVGTGYEYKIVIVGNILTLIILFLFYAIVRRRQRL